MSKRYFRRREPQCGLEAAEWIEMTGREFYQFVNSPEGQGRHFIDMGDVVLESTEMEAKLYRAEKDRSDYLREQAERWSTLSMYALEDEYGCSGEDTIIDPSVSVEEEATLRIRIKALRNELALLDAESYQIIYELHLAKERKTLRQYSQEHNIPVMTVHYWRKKIFQQLAKKLSKENI